MRQPPPSYLDPNNVLTAWGSSEAQLGLQVLPMLPFPSTYPPAAAPGDHLTCLHSPCNMPDVRLARGVVEVQELDWAEGTAPEH